MTETKVTETTKAQIAGRVERVDLTGTTPPSIPELFDLSANPADIGPPTARNLSFTPKSGSVGLIQDLPWGLVASITGQYVERAPKPAEARSAGEREQAPARRGGDLDYSLVVGVGELRVTLPAERRGE